MIPVTCKIVPSLNMDAASISKISQQSMTVIELKSKGGLPAALFKPRTVKGTASKATPLGCCLAQTRR